MHPLLEEILRTQQVSSAEGDKRSLGANVSVDEGLWLQKIIQDSKAVNTLEVGLWYGISTLFICEAIANQPNASHIVMDPNQFRDCAGIGLNHIKMAGYSNLVEFFNQSSHIVLPQLESRGTKIDFAFVDGSHLFDYTLLEFFYIDKLLRVGGIIAFDDVMMPGVRKVCRFINTNRSYSVVYESGSASTTSKLKRAVVEQTSRLFPPLKSLLRSEFQDSTIERGLFADTRYLAFRKEAEDTEENRPWNFYRDF